MPTKLEQAISAVKGGDKATGQRLLAEVLKTDPCDETAWLWLTQAVDSNDERITYLRNVLQINPNNKLAKRGLAALQQKRASQSQSVVTAQGVPVPEYKPISPMTPRPAIRLSVEAVLQQVTAVRTRGFTPDLNGVSLAHANLSGADLSDASMRETNLSQANLRQANLGHSNLSGAALSGANLSGANLSGAYLPGSDLSGADLSKAKLNGGSLVGANLREANLSGANLSRADLSGVKHNPQTIWPTGFTAPDSRQPMTSPEVEILPPVKAPWDLTFVWGKLSNHDFALLSYLLTGILIVTLILVLVFGLIAILFLPVSILIVTIVLVSVFQKSRCPRCHQFGAKVDLREETLALFRRIGAHSYDEEDNTSYSKMLLHEKVKFYHRCKYCDYEWTSTRTRRI